MADEVERVARQFERIKTIERALANGADRADDPECHPCYPTLVAARQELERLFAAAEQRGFKLCQDAAVKRVEAMIKLSKHLGAKASEARSEKLAAAYHSATISYDAALDAIRTISIKETGDG